MAYLMSIVTISKLELSLDSRTQLNLVRSYYIDTVSIVYNYIDITYSFDTWLKIVEALRLEGREQAIFWRVHWKDD
jgi:hypothetical protein